MHPDSPSDSDRLAQAIDESRRLIADSKRFLERASGAWVYGTWRAPWKPRPRTPAPDPD